MLFYLKEIVFSWVGCPQTNLIFSQISCLIVNVYLHLQSLLTALRASRHSGDTCPGDNIVLILISSNLRKVTTIMDIWDKDHWSSSSAGCKDPSQGRLPQSHTDDSYILLYNTDYDGGGGSPSPPNVWVQVVGGGDR